MDKSFVITTIFVILFDFISVTSKPLSDEQSTLNLEKQSHGDQLSTNVSGRNPHIKDVHEETPDTSKNITSAKSLYLDKAGEDYFPSQNFDTKKHYYLLKISEYYDFLPRYFSENGRRDEDRLLQFEIDDSDDPNLSRQNYYDKDEHDSDKTLMKRDTSDKQEVNSDESVKSENVISEIKKRSFMDTIEENIDVFQDFFVKRDVYNAVSDNNDEDQKQPVKRDLGNFAYEPDQLLSADSDDPNNNNYRYIAYVPFFKVRKYYIQRKRLDLGL